MVVYRKFRVREEFYRVIKYVEWKLLYNGRKREEIKHLVDEIIQESLDKIYNQNLNVRTDIYGQERDVLGYTLQNETVRKLDKVNKRLKLYAGELVEVCLYMYFIEHFSEEEQELNKMKEWSITIY
jgi:hypothetical protein